VLSLVGAYVALEMWSVSLSTPLRYAQVDDTKFYFGLVKGILEHGWYQHNPSLGAPFGQVLYDFPQGADNLNFLLIKAIGLFSHSYAVVTNVFFLLTFPLTGLAAFYALRRLGAGAAIATVCSVLFALLPYHLYRHESQVLLSAYYSVPLSAYLFLSLFGDDPPPLRRRDGRRLLGWRSGQTVGTLVICVVIGSSGLYYAAFGVLMLAAGTVVAAFARRGRRTVWAGAVMSAAIALTLAANLAPSLIYTARHGSDPQIARTALESEQLGLRLSTLLLPVRGDRLPPLASVNNRYAATTSPGYCESCFSSLGTVGAAGFVLLGLIGLAGCVGAAAGASGLDWQRPFRPAALGAALAFLIGTTGGISALFAFLLTPDLRGWNRISLFIAFFSLVAVGLVLERIGRRISARGTRPSPRALAGAGLAALLILGALDETSNFFVPDYATSTREYRSDQAFGRAIQAHVAPGSAILELPYVPFPEGFHVAGQPPVNPFSNGYELLRPYLNTHGLRFSFGAIKGRPADWEASLASEPLDVVVAAAAAADFRAIYVDPLGYGPAVAARVRAGLTRLLGAGPLVSPLGDAWLFDLRPYLRRLRHTVAPAAVAAARTAALDPLRTVCGSTPDELTLVNPGRTPRPAILSLTIAAPLPGGVTLEIGFPDGGRERRRIGAQPLRLSRRVTVAPGSSAVELDVVGRLPFGAGVATPPFVVTATRLTDRRLLLGGRAAAASLPSAGLTGPTCNDIYAASPAAHLTPPPDTD
jgi:phosphoglycerol transferase